MLFGWACFGLLVLSATISEASRTILASSSKTIVHDRSHVAIVDLHAKKQEAPVVGKTTKTVVHQKVPGNGYKPGSPLYNVQEGKESASPSTAEPKDVTNGTRQEKLYACVDHELAKLDAFVDQVSPQEVMAGTNACMQKYDATPTETIGIEQRTIKAIMKFHFWTVLVTMVIAFILTLTAAFIYQRNKKDPAVDPSRRGMAMDREDFHFGICSCSDVPSMSLLTCCCFAIRWADTMRMASFLGFWVGVVLITFLELINGVTGGAAACFAWFIVVFYRQKLRKEFGLEHNTLKSCCCDICGYCWIPCCMAVQEARQLEEAYAVGHPIRKVAGSSSGRF